MPSDKFYRLPDKKREIIIKAARMEFTSKRFEEAKVVNICRESGIPRNTFYSYFQSLDDIYDYIYCKTVADESNPHSYVSNSKKYNNEDDVRYFINLIDSGGGIQHLYENLKVETAHNKIMAHIGISMALQYKEKLISAEEFKEEFILLSEKIL